MPPIIGIIAPPTFDNTPVLAKFLAENKGMIIVGVPYDGVSQFALHFTSMCAERHRSLAIFFSHRKGGDTTNDPISLVLDNLSQVVDRVVIYKPEGDTVASLCIAGLTRLRTPIQIVQITPRK